MELDADGFVPFPRPLVFATNRDHLIELARFLPNVRRIEVRSRDEDGDVVRLVNVWHGGGEIPAAARAVLSESMLSWTDHATWDPREWVCRWRTETHAFTEAVDCAGTTTFVEKDGGTLLRVRGELRIDAKRVRGVPGFLATKLGRVAEETLAGKIRPNLVEIAKGLRKYLEGKAAQTSA